MKRTTVEETTPYIEQRTAGQGTGRFLGTLAILWLSGIALRLTILAVAPVLPMIHHDLGLSET